MTFDPWQQWFETYVACVHCTEHACSEHCTEQPEICSEHLYGTACLGGQLRGRPWGRLCRDFGADFEVDLGANFGADLGADFRADFGADFWPTLGRL